MPINREFRPILAKKVANSFFKLIVKNVDFELKLYDNYGMKFSVTKDQLNNIGDDDWPYLNNRIKYVIRYNNMDSGVGIINVSIIQILPDNRTIELDAFSYFNIHGKVVFEIPFYLKYED
jgi:hypothetical protein